MLKGYGLWMPACSSPKMGPFVNHSLGNLIRLTSPSVMLLLYCLLKTGSEVLLLCVYQPPQKTKPSTMISTNIEGLRTDDEVRGFLRKHKGEKTALIKFGSSWCYHCQEVFPQFLKLTKQVEPSKKCSIFT